MSAWKITPGHIAYLGDPSYPWVPNREPQKALWALMDAYVEFVKRPSRWRRLTTFIQERLGRPRKAAQETNGDDG